MIRFMDLSTKKKKKKADQLIKINVCLVMLIRPNEFGVTQFKVAAFMTTFTYNLFLSLTTKQMKAL